MLRHAGLLLVGGIAVTFALYAVQVISPRQFDMVIAISLSASLVGLVRRFGGDVLQGVVVAALLAGAAVLTLSSWPQVRFTPYLPIAGTYLGLAYVFGHGLLPGRTPILLQLIRVMGIGPDGPPDFLRFVRGQCLLWMAIALVLGAAALAGMVAPSLRPVLDPAIWTLIAGQAVWFLLSHIYAGWRYDRPETWLLTLRAMARPKTWTVLEI